MISLIQTTTKTAEKHAGCIEPFSLWEGLALLDTQLCQDAGLLVGSDLQFDNKETGVFCRMCRM